MTPILNQSPADTSGKSYKNFIGIANSAISDAATGTITSVGGIGTGQSSLTVGKMYSVADTGVLEARSSFYTTASYSLVGVALTATTIYITGAMGNG